MKYLLQLFLLCFLTDPLFADSNSQQDHHPCMFSNSSLCEPISSRPDAHAPIGVMGDHGHKQGEWMVSSRLVFRQMESFSSLNKMNMWLFMQGAMYGVTDKFTVMAMIPYMYSSIGHGRKGDGRGRDGKQGYGKNHGKESDGDRMSRHRVRDISLTGLYSLSEGESYKTLFTFGLLASPRVQNYMGTYGVHGNFVFVNYWPGFSVGSQIGLKSLFVNIGQNHENFVNLWSAIMWSALMLNNNASLSARVRLKYQHPHLHYPIRAFVYVGGNFIGTDFAEGHRLALEVGTPLHEPSLIALLGWQKTF